MNGNFNTSTFSKLFIDKLKHGTEQFNISAIRIPGVLTESFGKAKDINWIPISDLQTFLLNKNKLYNISYNSEDANLVTYANKFLQFNRYETNKILSNFGIINPAFLVDYLKIKTLWLDIMLNQLEYSGINLKYKFNFSNINISTMYKSAPVELNNDNYIRGLVTIINNSNNLPQLENSLDKLLDIFSVEIDYCIRSTVIVVSIEG